MRKGLSILLLLWIGAAVHSQSTGFSDFSFTMPPDMEEAMLHADMALMKLDGRIPMRFSNALDGKAIAGAAVEIPGIGSFVTDSRGIISFPKREDGSFTLVFTKAGFIPTAIAFKIQVSTVINNWYAISPELAGDFRFVLDWGEKPADLDIHWEKQGGYHISYRNMRTPADGSAKLDRDDMSGYGPETVTVDRAEASGVYHLYVIDYTNGSNSRSTVLSGSGATIRVYSRNRLLETFTVPSSGNGYRWNVCDVVQNRIVPVGTISR
ncbi:MAG: hypothetical protein LBB43_05840 [Spirochaetaceae bacterium]|jgi:hypothetical protein|nr:hypothetical protein [Spirochaetaceae bacterium]